MIEPISLYEADVDVAEKLKGMEIATEIALEVGAKIKTVTGLNYTAGISYNKLLAKMASDLHKPNGRAESRRRLARVLSKPFPSKNYMAWGGDGRADETAWHRDGT